MKPTIIFLLILVAIFSLTLVASAANGGYGLSWFTIDGGSGESTGGDYSMSGTIGQPDANLLTGGDYTLSGGFWGGGKLATTYITNLPLIQR